MKATEVFDLVKEYLDNEDFKYESDDSKMLIKLTVHGKDLPQPTFIEVDEKRDVMRVISPMISKISEEKRMEAAVAVSVANFGMVNGSFDLDMSDGEIRFRLCQSFLDCTMTLETMKYLLGVSFFTTDRYNDLFFMLGNGMMTLEQFIEKES